MDTKKNAGDQTQLSLEQVNLLLLCSERGDNSFDLTEDIFFPLQMMVIVVFVQG